MRHRPMFKFPKLPQSLYFEMSGSGWAQQDQPDLFKKMAAGENLTYDESKEAREGLDDALAHCEAVLGGGGMDFEEGRTVNAAKSAAEARLKKLDAYLKSNE